MATSTQRNRLRADVGANEVSLPNTEADEIFVEAAESYSTEAAIKAYTRVIAIQRLLASSAKLTTYRQNLSSENASDVFKHLDMLLDRWEKNLAKATAAGQSVVSFGKTRRIPRPIKEYPNG